MYRYGMVREGKRSEHTKFTRAVQMELAIAIEQSPVRSIYGLSKEVSISRSQLYLLLTGDAVIDLADLEQICAALKIDASAVIERAENHAYPSRYKTAEGVVLPLEAKQEPGASERTYPQPMDEAAREQE